MSIFIFALSLSLVNVWNSSQSVYALYFGNDTKIYYGNVSSPFMTGQIATIDGGSVYIVWVGKENSIYFSSGQENGTKFSTPILLSDNNTLASSPQIAATEKGDVYVVWVDKNNATGDSNVVFRSSNDYGKDFDRSVPLTRNLNQTSITSSPQIAATERGDVYVVWVDKNNATGDSNVVFRSSNDYGKDFDRSVPLTRNPSPNQTSITSSPQIAATEKGDVYVVWVNKKGITGDTNIAFINSNDSGKDFSNRKLLRANNLFSFSPQMSTTENGSVYVVWVDKNNATGDSNVVFRSSNDYGKDFDRSVRLNRNVSPNETSVTSSPQIAATESGNVNVVWVDKNNATGDSNVVFRSSNDYGKDFDRSVRLNRNVSPNETSMTSSPQIAATESGNVNVVWVDKNNATGDSNVVFRSSNDYGKDFDRSVRLNRNPNQTSTSYLPQIAATETGSVYVVWSENNLQFKEILDNGSIFGRTISLNKNNVLPLLTQIVATENGNIYLLWAEKNSGTDNDTLLFKRISQSYFDRNL